MNLPSAEAALVTGFLLGLGLGLLVLHLEVHQCMFLA
jgi:hypothetical protein